MKTIQVKQASYQVSGMKKFRQINGVTFRLLAQRTGLSIGYLSDVERGRRNISESNLQKLEQAIYSDSPTCATGGTET